MEYKPTKCNSSTYRTAYIDVGTYKTVYTNAGTYRTAYTDAHKTNYTIPVYTTVFLKMNPRVRNM